MIPSIMQSPAFLPDFTVTDLASDKTTTLHSIGGGKGVVLDFWTTKCVRCPSALSKLNEEAPRYEDFIFCSCVLDNKEIAVDVIEG